MTETFMSVEDHFQALLETVPEAQRQLYETCRHVRSEQAFAGRQFVIYQMDGREPDPLDRIIVNDFMCDDREGATCEMTSTLSGRTITVGYTPRQLFDYPVLVWLPLHGKVRWAAGPSDPGKGSLAFQLTIRTQSRLHLRERGVVYCETGPTFGREFDEPQG